MRGVCGLAVIAGVLLCCRLATAAVDVRLRNVETSSGPAYTWQVTSSIGKPQNITLYGNETASTSFNVHVKRIPAGSGYTISGRVVITNTPDAYEAVQVDSVRMLLGPGLPWFGPTPRTLDCKQREVAPGDSVSCAFRLHVTSTATNSIRPAVDVRGQRQPVQGESMAVNFPAEAAAVSSASSCAMIRDRIVADGAEGAIKLEGEGTSAELLDRGVHVCGESASFTYTAAVGPFDELEDVCGSYQYKNSPTVDVEGFGSAVTAPAAGSLFVGGCRQKDMLGMFKPLITISKLQTAKLANTTWAITSNSSLADGSEPFVHYNATAVVRSTIQGNILVPPQLVSSMPGTIRCVFDAPVDASFEAGTIQAQYKTVIFNSYADGVDSGPPAPYSFSSNVTEAESGSCVDIWVKRVANESEVSEAELASNPGLNTVLGAMKSHMYGTIRSARYVSGRMPPVRSSFLAMPYTVCGNATIEWAEQYGPYTSYDCGTGVSLLAVTASDTKAKDRDLAHGVLATPLTINGCGFVPQVAIADIRVTARKQFNWGVEKLASPESLSLKYDQQGLVKYDILYTRSQQITGHKLQALVGITNPHAIPLSITRVAYSISRPEGQAPLTGIAVFVVPTPDDFAAHVSVRVLTNKGEETETVTLAPVDWTEATLYETGRCAQVSSSFLHTLQQEQPTPLIRPASVSGSMPPNPDTAVRVCDPVTYSFRAMYGPFKETQCGVQQAIIRAAVAAQGEPTDRSDNSVTIINVSGCPDALPILSLAPATATQIVSGYEWSVERSMKPLQTSNAPVVSAAGPGPGLNTAPVASLSMTASSGSVALFNQSITFRRSQAIPFVGDNTRFQVKGVLNIVNPGDNSLWLTNVEAKLTQPGAVKPVMTRVYCPMDYYKPSQWGKGLALLVPPAVELGGKPLSCTYSAMLSSAADVSLIASATTAPDGRWAKSSNSVSVGLKDVKPLTVGGCVKVGEVQSVVQLANNATLAEPGFVGSRVPKTPEQLCFTKTYQVIGQLGPLKAVQMGIKSRLATGQSVPPCGAVKYSSTVSAEPTTGYQGKLVNAGELLVNIAGCQAHS
ncbi:hypothetical protein OEZ86_001351 [Tetradesmus obliquus]|nr:hypothetical protein OEZ86_001351 [Tetradesmus obliquus]